MRLIALLTSTLAALTLSAGDFGCHWVASPEACDTAQVWFRRTYRLDQRPQWAAVTVATAGTVQVFVNERRLTRNELEPLAATDDTLCRQITVDVTRFMREGRNVIAAWYSPRQGQTTDKQLALTFYGCDYLGRRFAFEADHTWRCHLAEGITLPGGGEAIDGQQHNANWKGTGFYDGDWPLAWSAASDDALPMAYDGPLRTALRRVATLSRVSTEATDSTLTCRFERAFTGWIRLTMRGTQRGERIDIGSLSYRCAAGTDEQMARRFTTASQQEATITGDDAFHPSQIWGIEGIEIAPRQLTFNDY